MTRPLPPVESIPIPILELSNFRGLNDRDTITEIGDTESPDLRNIAFDTAGGISKRDGVALVGNDKGDVLVRGLHPCYFGDGSAQLLMASQSATTSGLWYRTTGNYTEAGLDAGGTKLANANTEFANFFDGTNEVTFIADGTTFQKYLNSDKKIYDATGRPGDVAAGDTVTILKLYKNRLYASGATSLPERVYFSALGDGDDYSANDYFDVPSQSSTQTGKSGDPITALAVFQDRLFIFKNRSIWYYDTDTLRELTNKHGCVGTRAVTVAENYLYFADNDGVYRISGNFVEKVSKKIQTTWDAIPAARIPETVLEYFGNKLYVATAAAAATTNNIVLVNYLTLLQDEEGQTPWTYWEGTSADPISVSAFVVYEASVTTLPILVYSCAIAQSVTLQLGSGTGDYDFSKGSANQDIAISSYYKTKVFYLSARYKRLYATYKAQSNSSYLKVGYDIDFGLSSGEFNFEMKQSGVVYGTGVYGTAVYGGETAIIAKDSVSGRGKYIQYRIENNVVDQPYTFYQIKQLYKPIKIR